MSATGEFGGMVFACHQRLDHGSARHADVVGDDRIKFDIGGRSRFPGPTN
jgi:hypothetical protein